MCNHVRNLRIGKYAPVMLPDKVTKMENSIGYHTSINQSEESISIRCIIIYNVSLHSFISANMQLSSK